MDFYNVDALEPEESFPNLLLGCRNGVLFGPVRPCETLRA